MAYKKLNEALKKELLKKVDEMEINVEELKSYHFEKNPYCVEPQLIGTSGEGQWDENKNNNPTHPYNISPFHIFTFKITTNTTAPP